MRSASRSIESAERSRVGAHLAREGAQRDQRSPALQRAGPGEEVLGDDGPELGEARRLDESGRERRRRRRRRCRGSRWTESRTPNMPSRSSSDRRISTVRSLTCRSQKWSAESSICSSCCWSPAASGAQRARFVFAHGEPGLGEQTGERAPRSRTARATVSSARYRSAMRAADSIASRRPAPISSARESTPTALTGDAAVTERSMNASRKSMSLRCAWRIR